MARSTWALGAVSVLATTAAITLYLDNRALHRKLDALAPVATAAQPAPQQVAARAPDPWLPRAQPVPSPTSSATPAPALPEQKEESRMERRARRTEEFAAMFGRLDGETEEEYRARIVPLIKAGLALPRSRVAEMRKIAEEKAKVTAEQSKKLDRAFDKVYDNVLDYTNKAIADGTLSPYERNVAGWLEYAGGLGGILNDAQGDVGHILSADQVKTMYDSGFEWGEYLGANVPWEQLTPPPPKH